MKTEHDGKPNGRWVFDPQYQTWTIQGRDCTVWMAPRPTYCDRGAWLAHIEVLDPRRLEIDGADLWPRYYFDLERAKLEVEAFLQKRQQWIADPPRFWNRPPREEE